jgi:hypothetical protein
VLEPPDDQLWHSVETTVRMVLLPAIEEEWARVIAIQLAGMAHLARTRAADQAPARAAELAVTLDTLAVNPIVAAHWPAADRTPPTVFAAVGSVLADAVSRQDAAGDQVRAEVRSIVSRHLDDDLAVTGPLMAYFRGQLPDA